MHSLRNILQLCQQYVQKNVDQADSSKLYFHDFAHSLEVVKQVNRLSVQLKEEQQYLLQYAAWMHDIGYLIDYTEHENRSIAVAQQIFEPYLKDAQIQIISACIETTKIGIRPKNKLEALLKDADSCYSLGPHFVIRGNALRKEWHHWLDKEYKDQAWKQVQLQFLQELKLYSSEAEKLYRALIQHQLELLQQKKAR